MNHPGPYKPRDPGSVKDLVDRLVDLAGGPKKAAEYLGRSPSQVAGYTDPAIDQHMTLAQALTLQAITGSTLLADFVAHSAGGRYVPHKCLAGTLGDDLETVASAVGAYVAVVTAAAADGALDESDKLHILMRVKSAIIALGSLGLRLEPSAEATPRHH